MFSGGSLRCCTPLTLHQHIQTDGSHRAQQVVDDVWRTTTRQLQQFLREAADLSQPDTFWEAKVDACNQSSSKLPPKVVLFCVVYKLLGYNVRSLRCGYMMLFSFFLELVDAERRNHEVYRGLWQMVCELQQHLRRHNLQQRMHGLVREVNGGVRGHEPDVSLRTRQEVSESPALFVETSRRGPFEDMTTVAHIFPRALHMIMDELTGERGVNSSTNLLHMFSFHAQCYDHALIIVQAVATKQATTVKVRVSKGLVLNKNHQYMSDHLALIPFGKKQHATHGARTKLLRWRQQIVEDMLLLQRQLDDDIRLANALHATVCSSSADSLKDSCSEEEELSDGVPERDVHARFQGVSGCHALKDLCCARRCRANNKDP
ncbi:hypothetical protein AB1Y20_013745 [Prymnesium parvum]|uniref:HNH nuclease domain-containing protein n=1 Tax=Prymnesium parvum TaxID=97485 RepID=A0AB34IH73_PRYPA